MRKLLAIVSLVVLLAACSQQQAVENLEAQVANTWKPLGSALDIVPKNNVANARLLLDRNGKVVVLWAEDNGLWYLQGKRWNGTSWEKLAFPTRPLAYDDKGVIPFDIVYDSSNALVINQPGKILRATTQWIQLGSGSGKLQTDQYGRVHALFTNTTTGDNTVKRWTGTTWQSIATLNINPNDGIVSSFALKTDGKPVIKTFEAPTIPSRIYKILGWNGQLWSELYAFGGPSGSGLRNYALTSSNKLITITGEQVDSSIYLGGEGLNIRVDISTSGSDLGLKNNLPVVLYTKYDVINTGSGEQVKHQLLVKTWTGTKLTQLGGVLNRSLESSVYVGNVVVDKSGTIFAVWQEGRCSIDGCVNGGGNIYVSQYVP